MFGTILEMASQNQGLLHAVAAFITGVCLLYLVMNRTIQKRRRELDEAAV